MNGKTVFVIAVSVAYFILKRGGIMLPDINQERNCVGGAAVAGAALNGDDEFGIVEDFVVENVCGWILRACRAVTEIPK